MEKINKYNLSAISLAVNNAPKIVETSYNEYIRYGEDNLYPQLLIDLLNSSALHNSIVQTRKDLVVGDKLIIKSNEVETRSLTEDWLYQVNPKETFMQVFEKLVYDYEVFGGYALNVIWSRDRTKIVNLYHIDFSTIRSGIADMHGQVNEYYYSPDWSKSRYNKNKPVRIPAFNKVDTSEPSQLIYHKGYRPGLWYYPVPSYVAAQNWIELDGEISNFHLNNVKNGMVPGMWVNFTNGQPSDEERRAIYKAIEQDFQGSGNAGKFVITFSEGQDTSPTFQPLGISDADKTFLALQDLVLQNVLSAHQLTSPMLAGIKTPGSLGGRSELLTSFELYNKAVIQPDKAFCLEPINTILDINGLSPITTETNKPLDIEFSENILKEIMTTNELRSMLGLEEIQ